MEPENNQETQSPQSTPEGSSKPSISYMLILYGVIAVVLVGLIFFLYRSKKQPAPFTTTSQDTVSDQVTPTTEVSTTSATQEPVQKQETVTLTSTGFNPQKLTIKAGTKVTWVNQSGVTSTVDSADHPTHLKYPPLNLGSFANGEAVSLVFDKPGTYGYHNHLNSTQFGSVTVE